MNTKASCAVLALVSSLAQANDYPKKPITFLVGYAAGGPSDTLTRIVSDELARKWGVPIIVDNRPGATATIATAAAAKSKADGYTFLVIANDFVASRFTHARLSYDPVTDIAPIGLMSVTPNVLVVSDTSGYKRYGDFYKDFSIKHADWSYSSTGVGSTSHLAVEIFSKLTGKAANHVPYKGFAPSLPDLMTGRINFAIPSLASVNSQFTTGRLIPLAVAGTKRSIFLPQVPTFDEVGVRGFNVQTWYGLAAPAGLPAHIKQKVTDDLNEVLRNPNVIKKIQEQGSETNPISTTVFEKMIADEVAFTADLLKGLNVQQ